MSSRSTSLAESSAEKGEDFQQQPIMEELGMTSTLRDTNQVRRRSSDATNDHIVDDHYLRRNSISQSYSNKVQRFFGHQDQDFYPAGSLDTSYSVSGPGGEDQTHIRSYGSWVYGNTEVLTGLNSVQVHTAPVAVRMATFNAMPKLELHAHLNGCVRSSTLLELYLERGCEGRISNSDLECLILKEDRSLTECFRLFPVIHALTTDHAIVKRITKEAIEDFIRDNVVYLELRTTPKSNEAYGMSKRSYVEAVLAGFEAAEVSYNTKEEDSRSKHLMQVRLLLSIDRRESTEEAMETVELAWELRCRGVVGIDLSGDPVIGTWKTFLPALMRAKQLGVPLTLHCGEVPNSEEVRAMIALKPNRLGHVCCLEEEEWKYLLDSGIPVEVCLTSNVSTESVPSVTDHHFGLSEIELLLIAKSAVNYTFADDMTKLALHRIFDDALEKMQGVKSTSEG